MIKWLPLIATLGLLYVLRWSHIGVIDFKLFVLIMVAWSFLLILFYKRTAPPAEPGSRSGGLEDVGLGTDD
ncbi:MAG: hypothetical protein V1806_16915 [Pseudomonadota bacterium]